jgi:lysozyme family protein
VEKETATALMSGYHWVYGMSDFDLAIAATLKSEGGGYVADDHGRGPSRWGVTLATAHEFHPNWKAEDIESLTLNQAKEFYRGAFWNKYLIGAIQNQAVAAKVLDLTINMGPATAFRLLQGCVHVAVDGVLGQITLQAVNTADPEVLLADLRARAAGYYTELAEHRPELAHNLSGWLARLEA